MANRLQFDFFSFQFFLSSLKKASNVLKICYYEWRRRTRFVYNVIWRHLVAKQISCQKGFKKKKSFNLSLFIIKVDQRLTLSEGIDLKASCSVKLMRNF